MEVWMKTKFEATQAKLLAKEKYDLKLKQALHEYNAEIAELQKECPHESGLDTLYNGTTIINTRCLLCFKEFGPPREEKEAAQFDATTELQIQQEVNKRVNQIVTDLRDEERWKYSIEHGFK
jgi:phage-related minor tail protein